MTDHRPLWVDFSWLLFRSWHSQGNLGIWETVMGEDGPEDTFRPTGHIFGVLKDIAALSRHFPEVVLALDGGKDYRRQIFPGYKQGRKPLEYPIFKDQPTIVRMASHFPNVKVAWKRDYEADDLISTVLASQTPLVIWTRDRDIMQMQGNWAVLDDIYAGEPRFLDLPAYIEKGTATDTKPGLMGFGHLPCWFKAVRGDSSDKIPGGIPRMKHEVLMTLLHALAGTRDLNDFYAYLLGKEILTPEKLEELRPGIERNFKLIMPRFVPDGESFIYRFTSDPRWVQTQLDNFQLNSLFPIFFPSQG
jgi:5'-3' exonuclease